MLRLSVPFACCAAIIVMGGCSSSQPDGAAAIGGRGGTATTASGGAAGAAITDAGWDATGGCGLTCRRGPPCPTGWYLYSDRLCSPPPPSGAPDCASTGDGLCYQPCTSAADCADPYTPKCAAIYVYNGSDVGRPMTVCTSDPPIPACLSVDAGHGG